MDESLTPRSEEGLRHLEERPGDTQAPSGPAPDQDAWGKDYRNRAECDRDRILYCSAFRRLAYVTQVTAPEAGHAFHNPASVTH